MRTRINEEEIDFEIRSQYPVGNPYHLPPVPKKIKGYVVKPVRNSKDEPKINRNYFCPCGSGLKYKKCCL